MRDLIQQTVSGLAQGGIYASLALALVLIYSAMGLVNFAQGEFAMFSAFVCWTLIVGLHLPYGVALVVTLLISMGAGVVIERTVIRPFEGASPLSIVIVTLALLSIANGMAGFLWGYVPKLFPTPFPTRPVEVGGIFFSIQDAGTIGVSVAVLAAMYVLFNRTRLGLAMRSAALYPESSRLLGIRVGWMLALGWGLATAVGAVAGILVAPIVFLEPNMMQTIVIYAFAAAVLGGIESPIGAVVGGLVLGVALNLIGAYIPAIADLRLPVALLLIVVVLVIRPSGLFGRVHARRV